MKAIATVLIVVVLMLPSFGKEIRHEAKSFTDLEWEENGGSC